MTTNIRPMNPGEHRQCEDILRGLPEWFGIEQSLVQYVIDTQTMRTWVACPGNAVVGFITLNEHNPYSAEIQVTAVAKAHHGMGYGRSLFDFVEGVLRDKGVEFLRIKTLAPSHPDPYYARTRSFYRHMGFKPFESNLQWGKANPCLIMLKHLKTG